MKIVAIGGGEIVKPNNSGGFDPAETTTIDKRIVELTEKANPKLLFIPTASGDSKDYFEKVKVHFSSLGCSKVDGLFLDDYQSPEEIEEKILGYDAIYVGGGNTLRMMNAWKRTGVDNALKKAAMQNIVLSGLSAGSICWFACGNSDSRKFTSGSDKLIKVTGLGLIEALHCPHFDAEPHRQADLKRMMQRTPKLIAIALDDCCALEVIDDKYKIVKSKESAKAYKAYWKSKNYIVEEMANHDYQTLGQLLKKI